MAEPRVYAAECSGRLEGGVNCPRQFTFSEKPERELELKCPHCGTVKLIKPTMVKEVK